MFKNPGGATALLPPAADAHAVNTSQLSYPQVQVRLVQHETLNELNAKTYAAS